MYSIERPKRTSPSYMDFLNCVANEWPDGKNNNEFDGVPAPILVQVNSTLAGGVSFTLHKSPEENAEALWVNVLYVKPEFRGRKLAAMLMVEVDNIVEHCGITRLYVYTDIPRFYIKLGWKSLSTDGKFSVLKYRRHT